MVAYCTGKAVQFATGKADDHFRAYFTGTMTAIFGIDTLFGLLLAFAFLRVVDRDVPIVIRAPTLATYAAEVHVVASGHWVVLGIDLTPEQAHESTRCEPLVQSVLDDHPGVVAAQVAGDKGYTGKRIGARLTEHGIEPVVARQGSERVPGDEVAFDREAYRRRGLIECCIGWLKECRVLATRFHKLAIILR